MPFAPGPGASLHEGVTCSQEEFFGFVYWCRATPWRVGDRLRLRRPLTTPDDTVWATVYRVYDGHFVFAKIDGDTSPALMSFVDTIDAAMPVFLQTGVPLLRHALGDAYPLTTAGSGQLLTIIGDFVGGRSWGCCYPDLGPSSVVLLGSTLGGSLPRVVHLLTHEFTHGWQQRWFHDSAPPEAVPFNQGPPWAMEGGSDLLSHEVIRRWSGVPWRANLVPVWPSSPRPLSAPWHAEALASGEFPAGYNQASSFLRDIVARAVEAGVPMDAAYREVARGALEDWFGYDNGGTRRTGLAGRMRATWDPAWEPGAALLGYALAQTADERTTAPGLNNPFFQLPAALIRAGFNAGTLIGGAGEAFTTRRGASHLGSLWLQDAGTGSSFTAAADQPNVAWAIARTR